MQGLFLPVLLIIIAAAVFFAEAFIPSGGLLGVIGVSSALAAIIFAFQVSSATGLVFIVITLILIPTAVIVGFVLLPRTPFGKKLLLSKTQTKEGGYVGQNPAEDDLLGQVGEAISNLRPAGIAKLGGKRYDVMTEGELVEKGTPIEVRRVEGNRIVVRALKRL